MCRKKHNKEAKEGIDAAVGYNDQLEETPIDVHSTVCKYCGEDFEFYRALKHHLRSHTSCRLKPFASMVCDLGFSTKSNCIRHIQNRHAEVEPSQWEATVKYNARDESTDNTPSQSPVSFSQTMVVPPSAHASKQLQDSALNELGKFSSPTKLDAPLDFSKKAVLESPSAILKAVDKAKEAEPEETVLDLSKPSNSEKISKPTSIVPSKPAIHPAFNILQFMNPALSPDMILKQQQQHQQRVFKCPFCHLQFNQESKLHLHMKMHATSRPFQCNHCPAGFTVKSNLDIHILTRHDKDSAQQHAFCSPARNRFISPNLKMIHHASTKRFSPYGFPQSKFPASPVEPGDGELASVSKLLDVHRIEIKKVLII